MTQSRDSHRISDRDGHQILSCFERARVYCSSARDNFRDRHLGNIVSAWSCVMRVHGQFWLDSRKVPGCVLRTRVMRRNHMRQSSIAFQKFGARNSYFMDYDIRALGILHEVLIRSHVARNPHRVSLVVNPEAERIFKIGMLDSERGDAHAIPLKHNAFLDVFGRNRYMLWVKVGDELA